MVATARGRARAARSRRSTCTAALGACSEHLERFGGHRAAAGLSIQPERLEAFAEAFAAHADAVLADEDLRPVTVIDAVVPASALTLDLAQELDRLAPFGLGNPDVTLLVASCEAVEPGTVGEGKHLRFRVRQHGRDAGSAIAFGMGSQLDRLPADGRFDVAFRLKENRWNGTVAPQLVVRRVFDAPRPLRGAARLARGALAGRRERVDARGARGVRRARSRGGERRRRQLLESEAFRALLERGRDALRGCVDGAALARQAVYRAVARASSTQEPAHRARS